MQKEKSIGGIPWSTLKVKRSDPNFDHMNFYKSLSKEDRSILTELLKNEKGEKGTK